MCWDDVVLLLSRLSFSSGDLYNEMCVDDVLSYPTKVELYSEETGETKTILLPRCRNVTDEDRTFVCGRDIRGQNYLVLHFDDCGDIQKFLHSAFGRQVGPWEWSYSLHAEAPPRLKVRVFDGEDDETWRELVFSDLVVHGIRHFPDITILSVISIVFADIKEA